VLLVAALIVTALFPLSAVAGPGFGDPGWSRGRSNGRSSLHGAVVGRRIRWALDRLLLWLNKTVVGARLLKDCRWSLIAFWRFRTVRVDHWPSQNLQQNLVAAAEKREQPRMRGPQASLVVMRPIDENRDDALIFTGIGSLFTAIAAVLLDYPMFATIFAFFSAFAVAVALRNEWEHRR
jgi:hypothetical protein